LRCTSRPDFDPAATDLHISVRSATTGSVLYSTGAHTCQMELPRGAEFEVAFDFQANLVPGLYHVETAAWDHARQRIVKSGPTRTFTVQTGANLFGGTVQLNATMKIQPLTDSPTGRATHHIPSSGSGILINS
jgi:hypothetical protein